MRTGNPYFSSSTKFLSAGVLFILLGLLLAGCGNVANATSTLSGSGSSFAAPAFDTWRLQFSHNFPESTVTYQSLGSGQGRSDFLAGKTDFGASDVQITAQEAQASSKNFNNIVQIPVVLGSIVLAFNLPGITGLNMSQETVCGIYTGKITRWNDPKVQADNPNTALPDKAIQQMVRSDSSGTTQVFTQYLSAICPDFKNSVGVSGLPDWKKAGLEVLAAGQNDGVAHNISLAIGGFGYIEQDYAVQYSLPTVSLKNGAGKFVKATKESIVSAVSSNTTELNLSLLNQGGDNTYPIVTTSYLLLNRTYADRAKGQAVVKFAQYILQDGQQDIRTYTYIPLPPQILNLAQAKLKQVVAGGEAVLN
ncbi:MAG: phosphate ABC transporter substrate-binding protein PstS [Chloroflexi bacterium]|nr:phosphate ABC transporter substrate-binding protein PstS [Chloroflexota bacterium]OJV99106.1 MAG: phosphate ABC transporter substrate-binding protein PstS [Chloroflexi bacterium 54-19]